MAAFRYAGLKARGAFASFHLPTIRPTGVGNAGVAAVAKAGVAFLHGAA